MKRDLAKAVEHFNLEEYIEDNFSSARRVNSNQEEIQINCFAPGGCGGSDRHRHLYVNVTKKQWYCHKCGYGDSRQQSGTGSLVRFIADAEKKPYSAVIEMLLGMVVPTPDENLTDYLLRAFNPHLVEPKKITNKYIELPAEVKKLTPHSKGNYLGFAIARGVDYLDLTMHDIRYVEHYQFPQEEGEKPFAWRWRVIFPVFDLEGKMRTAVGRTISKKEKYAWAAWPGSEPAENLWPLGFWSPYKNEWTPCDYRDEHVVLTEGVFDAHAVNSLTSYYSVCTFGKKISDDQIQLLQKAGVERVILAWDKNAKTQIERAVKKLSGRFKLSVFPFESNLWDDYDFGDMLLSNSKKFHSEFTHELDHSIPTDSPEYLAWLFK